MKIISVYNNLSNIGKSTITMLLANSIAEYTSEKVCVADIAKEKVGDIVKPTLSQLREKYLHLKEPHGIYADVIRVEHPEEFEKVKQEYDVIFLDLNEGLSREEIADYLLESHIIYILSVAKSIDEFKIDKTLVRDYFAKAIYQPEVPLEKIGYILNFIEGEDVHHIDEKLIFEQTNEMVINSGLHKAPSLSLTTFDAYRIPEINTFINAITQEIFDEPKVVPIRKGGSLA